VAEAIDLGTRSDLAIVGIGVPALTPALLGPNALLQRGELDALLRRGAVGDIAFRHFDADGRFLETDLDERVVGLDARALAAIPRRIGVAGGPAKTAAIGAALKGRLVDVLVTDEDTAVSLMAGDP
jgi:DNA-binding transcriptional regulator LsrR (DeoR family)